MNRTKTNHREKNIIYVAIPNAPPTIYEPHAASSDALSLDEDEDATRITPRTQSHSPLLGATEIVAFLVISVITLSLGVFTHDPRLSELLFNLRSWGGCNHHGLRGSHQGDDAINSSDHEVASTVFNDPHLSDLVSHQGVSDVSINNINTRNEEEVGGRKYKLDGWYAGNESHDGWHATTATADDEVDTIAGRWVDGELVVDRWIEEKEDGMIPGLP